MQSNTINRSLQAIKCRLPSDLFFASYDIVNITSISCLLLKRVVKLSIYFVGVMYFYEVDIVS